MSRSVRMEYRTTAMVQAEHVREWQADGWTIQPEDWPAHALRLPVSWYESIEAGSGVSFPIRGDWWRCDHNSDRVCDMCPRRHKEKFFAGDGIAHGSRPLPLRA